MTIVTGNFLKIFHNFKRTKVLNMILTLTMNPALDIYTRVEKINPTEKMRCEQAKVDPGGGGINVSRVIKRLGGNSTAIYTCGGYTGDIFKNLLSTENILQEPV